MRGLEEENTPGRVSTDCSQPRRMYVRTTCAGRGVQEACVWCACRAGGTPNRWSDSPSSTSKERIVIIIIVYTLYIGYVCMYYVLIFTTISI